MTTTPQPSVVDEPSNPDDNYEATTLATINEGGQDLRIFRRGAHIYTQIENYGEHDMGPIVTEDVFPATPKGFVRALRAAAKGLLEMIEEGYVEAEDLLGPGPGEVSHYHVGEMGRNSPHAHIGGGEDHNHGTEPGNEWMVEYRWQTNAPKWGVDWPAYETWSVDGGGQDGVG